MKTKEIQEEIVNNMRQWQRIENASVISTGKVMEKTENPIVRIIMEIIQHDSQMHYRVQELIAMSLQSNAIVLSTDELKDVWQMIENHIDLEKKTVNLAEKSLSALKGKKMLIQEYLLNYLLDDETKHNRILDNLGMIKKGMYPYA
jgi:hypothetical protein